MPLRTRAKQNATDASQVGTGRAAPVEPLRMRAMASPTRGTQRDDARADNGAMARPRQPVASNPHQSAVHLRVPALRGEMPAVDKPRVAMLEDDPHVTRALQSRFGQMLDLVPIPTLRDAERHLHEHWDAWIVDRMLPDGDGFDFALRLRTGAPRLSIVLHSAADHAEVFERATEAGIIYAEKPAGAAVLAQLASLWVERRQAPVDHIAARVFALATQGDLSDREEEVVWLALEGLSREEASERLAIAASTHKNHVTSILAKTGFENLRELLAAISPQRRR